MCYFKCYAQKSIKSRCYYLRRSIKPSLYHGGGMRVKLSKSDSAFNFETKKEDVDFVFLRERQILALAPVPGKPIIANPGLNIANRGMSFLHCIFLEAGGQKTR